MDTCLKWIDKNERMPKEGNHLLVYSPMCGGLYYCHHYSPKLSAVSEYGNILLETSIYECYWAYVTTPKINGNVNLKQFCSVCDKELDSSNEYRTCPHCGAIFFELEN